MSETGRNNQKKDTKIGDLAETAQRLSEIDNNSYATLFSYFIQQENSKTIREWGIRFQRNKKESFCELISLIFELAGHKLDVAPEHLETVSCDLLLEEFQTQTEDTLQLQKTPLFTFLKNKKKNLIESFWDDIAKQMISTLALFDESYVNYRSFLSSLCLCKIRILRQSAIYAVVSLYDQLTNQLNTTISDLERFEKIETPTEAVKAKTQTLKNEQRVYTVNANFLCNQILAKSIRDNEPSIRTLAAEGIGKGACNFPSIYGDENHLKYLEWGLKSSDPKQRPALMSVIQRVFTDIEPQRWIPLAETIEEDILKLCDDQDNQTVDASIRILLLMNENKCLHNTDKLDYVYALLTDQAASIRIIAAKFTIESVFQSVKSEDEELSTFIEFSKKFTPEELPIVISSLFGKIDCLSNWDLLCDDMLVIDDVNAKQLAKIILACAETGAGRLNIHSATNFDINETRTNLSVSLVSHLPRMITAFQTDPETQLPLIQAARVLDLDAVSENAAERNFIDLLDSIRDAFLGSTNKELFDSASSVLYELSQGSHQLNEIARTELDKLAVGCGDISKGDKSLAIPKFLSAARFVNMSDNDSIRDYLFECANEEGNIDQKLIRDSIECLMYFFQWDVLRLKKNPEEREGYEPMYHKLVETFVKSLNSADESTRKASILALSAVYALQPIINMQYTQLEESVIQLYCEIFHTVHTKTTSFFELAVRPIIWGTASLQYAAHFLVYICDETLKVSVHLMWNEIKRYAPIDGSEVQNALKGLETAGYGINQIMLSKKYIAKKFTLDSKPLEFKDQSDDDEPKQTFAKH